MNEYVTEGTLARFILGQLPPADRDRLEASLLVDDALFERLQMVENDLLDSYAREELEAAERQSLERLLAGSPALRERLGVAQALCTVAAEELRLSARYRRVAWSSGLGVAASLVLVTSLVLFLVRSDPADLKRESPTQGGQATVAPTGEITVDLFPGVLRDQAQPTLAEVPADGGATLVLRLDLDTQQPLDAYDVQVETADGKPVWNRQGLEPLRLPLGSLVELSVSASQLDPGRHVVVLAGTGGEVEAMVSYYELEIRLAPPATD